METAEERELEPGLTILMVSPVYFCASKLEAFGDRGKNDYLGSRDLEDLIAVVDGRAELVGEIKQPRAMCVPTSPRRSQNCLARVGSGMHFRDI
jgi:hypothetical protein